MSHDQVEKLLKIQETECCCIDLNLYLDTHPCDERALMEYNTLAYELYRLKKEYECAYGPLSNFGESPSQYPFQWIEDPWPWEIEY